LEPEQKDVSNHSYQPVEHEVKELEQEKQIFLKLVRLLDNKSDNLEGMKIELEKSLRDIVEKLERSEKTYRALYDNSPDLLCTINTKGIILNCNISYARTLGYSKNELIGTSIFDATSNESLEQMRDSFETWKKDGNVKNKEIWIKRKDMTAFPVLLSANNLYDDDGNIIGSNTVLRDITDIYDARRKIEQTNEKLEKEIKEKEEFTHLITNEVKSSAVHIRNITNTLLSQKSDMLDRNQIEKLENIKFKSQSILKMLSDIVDLDKIEHGSVSLNKNQCDISELIIGVISRLKEDADRRGSKILTEMPSHVNCFCDKEKIEKVLTEVIINAIDYTPKGNGKTHIIVDYEGTEYVKIKIRDNGIGIKAENIDKIFTKFYQADISVLNEHRGAGLGLSYCKGIIESHKGKIWAESKGPDSGITIHILLPATDSYYNILRKIE